MFTQYIFPQVSLHNVHTIYLHQDQFTPCLYLPQGQFTQCSHKISSPGSVHTMLISFTRSVHTKYHHQGQFTLCFIILSSWKSVSMMPTSFPRSVAHHGAGVFRSWMVLTECFWTPRAVGQELLPRIPPSRCPRSVHSPLKVMSPLSSVLGVRCRVMHCICC